MTIKRIHLLVLLLLLQIMVTASIGAADETLCVEKNYPHDPQAFTQGLIYHGGKLLESTGRYGGHSSVRIVDLETGEILKKRSLPPDVFAEGLALHGKVLYQLTWHNDFVYMYDPDTLKQLGSLEVPGEAWGLASDGQRLVMSDGSAMLRIVDPEEFSTLKKITVQDEKGKVKGLNELEFIEGFIYANINLSNRVVIINPETGQVVRDFNLAEFVKTSSTSSRRCLPNGIAYDPVRRCLLVTGKNCNQVWQIALPVPECPDSD